MLRCVVAPLGLNPVYFPEAAEPRVTGRTEHYAGLAHTRLRHGSAAGDRALLS